MTISKTNYEELHTKTTIDPYFEITIRVTLLKLETKVFTRNKRCTRFHSGWITS